MTIPIANKERDQPQGDLRKIKIAMLDQGLSVTQLAREIQSSRNAVSMAVNHGMFQGVLAKVKKRLGLS